MGANRVVYLSDTPPTLSPFKGKAVATEFITSTKTKLAKAARRAGKYGAMFEVNHNYCVRVGLGL
jgi:hypothetical protein